MVHLLGVIQPQLVISNKLAEPCIREALAGYKPPVALTTIEDVIKCWADDSYIEGFHLGLVEDTDTQVALVVCSSGTTGKPKGVEVTHLRLLLKQCIHLFPDSLPGAEMVILNCIPPYWTPYHVLAMFGLCHGHKIIQTETFEIENFFSTIQLHKVNICFAVNPHLLAIANHPSSDQFDLSSMRHVMFAGSTINQHVFDTAAKKLGCPITSVYGMSESDGMLRPAYGVRDRPGNVGKLGDGVKAKVVDLDSGKTVGPNCAGELRFITWTCFKGYRGNPQATQDFFDDEGYMCTGDLGYYDEEGFFYIVGRIKELFKYQLVHVCPSEIEEVLVRHPAVLEVAVVGIDHDEDFQHARAFVVLRPGASASEEELVKLVQESLPSYKWLYGGVRFIEALPRTATGKIQTYKLRK